MILHGLSPELLARLLTLDRPGPPDTSRLLFGPTEAIVVEGGDEETAEPLRWAAE